MTPDRRAALFLCAIGIIAVAGAIWLRWTERRNQTDDDRAPSSTPVVLGLAGVAGVIAFAYERGWYLGDNRFAWFWAPERSLGSIASAWNPEIDVGGPHQHYLPVMDAVLSALRATGLDAWVVQRIWFALLLALGSIGTALVVRAVLPGSRLAAAIGGAWFICSPFASGFLFPTALFLNVALAPWFVLAVWYGFTTSSKWRWAAVFALALAVSSSLNPPGLAFAVLPAAIVGAALIADRRASARSSLAWGVRAAFLSVLVLGPAVILTALTTDTLGRNLNSTESVDAVSLSSSWSESLRGLGFWLQYWNPRGPLVLPYLSSYFTNPWVLVATFIPPVLAGVALFAGRPRARLAFGVMLVVAVAFMVGAYPVGAQSPLGGLLRRSYEAVPALFAFRNTYKAGAGLVLAVAVLLAIGWRELTGRGTRSIAGGSRWRTGVLLGVVAIVFATSGWPLLSGNAFRYGQRLDGDLPGYWRDAAEWLDDQPGAGRVLVLPGSESEDYRWGSAAGGDMFAAILERPVILSQALTGSPAEAANLTAALDRMVTSGRYEPGTLAPIARRLGVQYVVIRNDLRWEAAGVARPSLLRSLRQDPDLTRAATFGAAGDHVTRPEDESLDVNYERSLAPVEIFAVPGVDDVVRAVSPAPALLVSGDGAGWGSLARSGVLDDLGPVRFTGSLQRGELADELHQGASIVITDTNRRSRLAWGEEERTLTATDDDRVGDLFGTDGSQSVVTFGDATTVSDAGPATIFNSGVATRAAAAFDSDPTTSWLTGINDRPRGQQIRIELTKPTKVDEVRVRVADVPGGRVVTSVGVVAGQQKPLVFDLVEGIDNVLKLPASVVDRVQIAPLTVRGDGGGPFGLSEVALPGLDVAERVTMPSDVAIAAQQDDEFGALLERAPLTVEMQRLISRPRDAEGALARRFLYPAHRLVELRGGVEVTTGTSARGIANLLGMSTWLESHSSAPTDTVAARFAASDGDEHTAWTPKGDDDAPVTLHSDGADIQDLRLVLAPDGSRRFPRRVFVQRAGRRIVVDAARRCIGPVNVTYRVRVAHDAATGSCSIAISWGSSGTPADAVTFGVQSGAVRRRLRLLEVEANGQENTTSYSTGTCRDDLLRLDGKPLPVRLDGSLGEVLRGDPIQVEGCATSDLTKQWHEVRAAPGLPFDWLRLTAVDGNAPVLASPVDVTVEERGADGLRVSLDAPAGTRVIAGQGHSPAWRAGGELGDAESFDAQAGWVLREDGEQELRISHAAHGAMRFSVGLSLLVLVLLPAVIVVDPRRRSKARIVALEPASARRAASLGYGAAVATSLFAFAVGGWLLMVVAVAALAGLRRGWLTPTVLGLSGVALVLVAAAYSLPPLGPSLAPVWPLWPGARDLAHQLVRLGVMMMLAAMSRMIGLPARKASPPPSTEGAPVPLVGVGAPTSEP